MWHGGNAIRGMSVETGRQSFALPSMCVCVCVHLWDSKHSGWSDDLSDFPWFFWCTRQAGRHPDLHSPSHSRGILLQSDATGSHRLGPDHLLYDVQGPCLRERLLTHYHPKFWLPFQRVLSNQWAHEQTTKALLRSPAERCVSWWARAESSPEGRSGDLEEQIWKWSQCLFGLGEHHPSQEPAG